MRFSTRATAVGALAALPFLAAPAAHADAPVTPAGTGGGCQENGQVLRNAAQGGADFGQFVSTQTPIANDVANFFVIFCPA